MNVKKASVPEEQAKKVNQLYSDARHWKSNLQFMQDEITFFSGLLNSYIFEPNTPMLFERLQDYQERLKRTIARKTEVTQKILRHENKLGGMLECKDEACDLGFYTKHNALKAEIVSYVHDFQFLKREIFNYAGGILKKKRTKE